MLNKEQEKAVYTKAPFLFLLAGAGTGKTRVIVERIKYLLSEQTDPSKILAITFTNRASKEMKERINNEKIAIHTFHQFCYQKLKTHKNYDYQIASENIPFSEQSLLKIAIYKNSHFREKKPKIYQKYMQYLSENHLKDFDDLLIDFHHYFHKNRVLISYDYIFVDEFQDTNELQYKIIKLLSGKNTKIFCVGDPDQSIYKFRGANDKIIQKYVKDYRADIYTLTINYRSNQKLLDIANGLIKRNNRSYKKELVSDDKACYIHLISEYQSQEDEAIHVINHIKNILKSGTRPSEIAILFRRHQRSFTLKEKLDEKGIKYQLDAQENTAKNSINLLTIHQAKGLEFSFVFIIGLEAGILPSYHVKKQSELEEERRLLFVAITRAKQQIFMSHVRFNNDSEHVKKSPFLNEIKCYI